MYLFENSLFLCYHDFLYPMKERKGKYIPGNLCNQIKGVLIKYWNRKRFMVLHACEDISDLTYYEISEINITCEEYTGQLWNDMKKSVTETTSYFIQVFEKNWQWTWRLHIWSLQNFYKKTEILLLHNYWRGRWIIIKQNIIYCTKKWYIDKTFWASAHWFWWPSSLYWCNI